MELKRRTTNVDLESQKPEVRNKKIEWKVRLTRTITLLLLTIFEVNLHAQSVDSLISEAIMNNPKLRSLKYVIISSEKRAESINTLPPPNLSVEFSQVPTNSFDVLNKSLSNDFSLSQMFPLGGKLNAMAEVERKNALIETDNYEIYKTNLIAQIKMSYYSLWLIDRKIEIQKKNISLLNDIIQSIESVYYTNRISHADVLSLQSEIASNETQLLIYEKQRDAEIYKINNILGRNLDSKEIFTLSDFEIPSIEFSQTELEKVLAESNPSINKMNSMISMNEAMIDANSRELIPDLMLQGMFMRMPYGMILTTKNYSSMDLMKTPMTDYMYSVMFSINLPFAPWSINKYKAKEENLSAEISSFEYEKLDMQREMTSQLKSALVKYHTAVDLVSLYNNKVIPLYSEAAESQVSAFQNNKTSVSTVIDSYRMLLMQQMNYYMAKADAQMAVAELEMMIGRKMTEL